MNGPDGTPLSPYRLERDTVLFDRKLETGHLFTIRATDIRKQPTGIHARISVLLDAKTMAWTNGNVERDEDRLRLANSAHKMLERTSEEAALACGKSQVKLYLDSFCAALWDTWIAATMPEEVGGEESPLVFLVKPYVLHQGGTILFAPPGAGKSWLGLLLAVSIDAGAAHPELWGVTTSARTLYINLERSGRSFQRRLAQVNRLLGLPEDRKLLMLNSRGRSLNDVIESCRAAVEHWAVDFIVLDSISRAGMGKLIADEVGNAIIDSLNKLCPTWLALAHSPRAEKGHTFGSQMFDAGADIIVQLLSQQDGPTSPLGIGLNITKANDLPKQPLWIRALEFEGEQLVSVRKAKPFEFPDILAGKKASLSQDVKSYLLEAGKASATTIAKAINGNRSNISGLLAQSKDFMVVGQEGASKLYGVRDA